MTAPILSEKSWKSVAALITLCVLSFFSSAVAAQQCLQATGLKWPDENVNTVCPGNTTFYSYGVAVWRKCLLLDTAVYNEEGWQLMGNCQHLSNEEARRCVLQKVIPYCMTGEQGGPNNDQCNVVCVEEFDSVKTDDTSCPVTQVGNPIDFRNGAKYEAKVDYSSGGAYPLVVRRQYSSVKTSEKLSDRWRFSFTGGGTRRLEFPVATTGEIVWVRGGDNSLLKFSSSDGQNFSSDSDVKLRLEKSGTEWVVIDSTDRVETFDSQGRVIKVQHKNGQYHTYSYNFIDFSVTDNFGRTLKVSRDDKNRIKYVDLPGGERIQYQYTSDGLLNEVTNTDGTTIQYHYEGTPGLLTGITDERGIRYATFGYDANGKANLTEHVGGVDSYGVVYNGLTSTVTNPLGKSSIHQFEIIQGTPKLKSTDRQASTYCGASAGAYTYDAAGFVDEKTDWEGNVTRLVNNSRGLAESVTYGEGTLDERTVTTQWHTDYRLPEVITEPGRLTTYTYNPYDDPNPKFKTVTDTATGETRTWGYTYNPFGKLLTVDGPRGDVTDTVTNVYYDCTTGGKCGQVHTVTNGLGQVTTYNTYNAHGQPTQITDANGVVTTIGYDQRQRPDTVTTDGKITSIVYTETGEIKRVTLDDATFTEYVRDDANRLKAVFDGEDNRIDWTLDDAGNRIDEKIKDSNGQIKKSLHTDFDDLSRIRQIVAAHGGTTVFGYDLNGNPTQHTDANNQISTSEYDALNRLVKDIDALSGETIYDYDDRDNLTTVTDPEGLTTIYTYNGFDEVVGTDSPDTGFASSTYDSAGNLKTHTDARGIVATYTYDALNRLTHIVYPDSTENIIYDYDQNLYGVGRLTQITDASGTTEYGYDARGNTTSVTQTVGSDSYTQSYTYNGANRLTGMTYPSGRNLTYGYDDSGRIDQVDSVGQEGFETLANTITRLPFGPLATLTLGNGVQRTRTFDQDYRVTTLSDGLILAKGLGYSPVNNITVITDSVNSNLTQLFTYDDLDRLDFAIGDYGEESYSYDRIGNRLSSTRDGRRESYSYRGSSHRLQSVAGQSYQYDAAGNTTNNGVVGFAYSARNRLIATTRAGVTTDYEHNALGQRVVKSNGDEEVHYVYDLEGRLVAEASAGSTIVEYVYLDGEPLVMWRDGDTVEEPTEPEMATLLSPTGTVDTANPTFTFEEASGATDYQLHVFDGTTGERVHNVTYSALSICEGGICSVTPSITLGEGEGHEWRVRSKNEVGNSSWTAKQSFDYTVEEPTEPEMATLLSPTGTVDTANPTFTFEEASGATDYQLHVFDGTTGERVHNVTYSALSICEGGICSVTPSITLGEGGGHEWRVRSKNEVGNSSWTAKQSFDYTVANSVLQNGSFESSLSSWESCSDEGSSEIVADAQEGSQALQITGSDCLYQEFVVTPSTSYMMVCHAKSAQTQYSSVTLTMMDSNYTALVTREEAVTSTGYQAYSATAVAPSKGVFGAVTFYSEDAGVFDACSVVEG